MDYRNAETKLESLVTYFNEERINLIPIFQRPKVWPLKMRKELIKNIVNGRPIPAIFLYKDEAGAAFKFNILDGKQRLDSLLMFIGDERNDFKIKTWRNYIHDKLYRKDVGFPVDFGDGKEQTFADLDAAAIRRFREYLIPTIEIELNENTSLNEMINLFVDINQYGVKVSRISIVRAMKQGDPLLKDVYALIAERQVRAQDVFTNRKKTSFVAVLKRLKIIASIADRTAQADRMWEKLFELALFVRSKGMHRKPTEILKSFIKKSDKPEKLSKEERATLTAVFTFLHSAYRASALRDSRLATDQTHFYIMATYLLRGDAISRLGKKELMERLVKFGKLIEKPSDAPEESELKKQLDSYVEISAKQTTDISRRVVRQKHFGAVIELLGG